MGPFVRAENYQDRVPIIAFLDKHVSNRLRKTEPLFGPICAVSMTFYRNLYDQLSTVR